MQKLLAFLVLVLGVVLFQRTLIHGDDFTVFWRASRGWWDGVSPYDLHAYGNMVFKYPPWILPFFFPFALLPLSAAKMAWGVIEVASLAQIVKKLARNYAVAPKIQILFLLIFSGLIIVHGIVGQITLPLLALAFTIDPLTTSPRRFSILALSFSTKIFTLFPLLMALKRSDPLRMLAGFILPALLLSTPVLVRTYRLDAVRLFTDWKQASFSGTQGNNRVRIGFKTREAQGFPSLFLRITNRNEENHSEILRAVGISVLFFAVFWILVSWRMHRSDQWWGWLALTPVVQPLAWFHFYLFAYPLFVLGAARALHRRQWICFGGFGVAALAVGAVTEKTLGSFGLQLELFSIKSWGVLLAVLLFAWVSTRRSRLA